MSKRYRPMGKQVDEVMARGSEPERTDDERREDWARQLEILVLNPVFRAWFTKVMFDYGGEWAGRADEMRQGQLCMLNELKASLASAPSAAKLFGEIQEKYWKNRKEK